MKINSFSLGIKPLSKERPRTGKSGHVYTPKRTKDYEDAVRMAAIRSLPDNWTTPTGPVKLVVKTWNAIPKSWKAADRQAALAGKLYPSKGDLDNRVKAISDALNGVYYLDDAQVVESWSKMVYGTKDMIYVAVHSIEI